MQSQLAALLTVGFIIFLFRRDVRENPSVSGAIWIPTLWLLIITTRAVTTWLSEFGFNVGGGSLDEGSPVDALVFFALIAAVLSVLSQSRCPLPFCVSH